MRSLSPLAFALAIGAAVAGGYFYGPDLYNLVFQKSSTNLQSNKEKSAPSFSQDFSQKFPTPAPAKPSANITPTNTANDQSKSLPSATPKASRAMITKSSTNKSKIKTVGAPADKNHAKTTKAHKAHKTKAKQKPKQKDQCQAEVSDTSCDLTAPVILSAILDEDSQVDLSLTDHQHYTPAQTLAPTAQKLANPQDNRWLTHIDRSYPELSSAIKSSQDCQSENCFHSDHVISLAGVVMDSDSNNGLAPIQWTMSTGGYDKGTPAVYLK